MIISIASALPKEMRVGQLALSLDSLSGPLISFLLLLSATAVVVPLGEAHASPACGDVLGVSTTLFSDINCAGSGLAIGDNGVTLNCAGHVINGSDGLSSVGILVANHKGVKVKNCVVTNFWVGISVKGGSKNTLFGNLVSRNSVAGIALNSSLSDTVSGNILNRDGTGVLLVSTNKTNIRNNAAIVSSPGDGFSLLDSNNNVLRSNSASGSLSGGAGFTLVASAKNILIGNAASGDKAGFVISGNSVSNAFLGNTASGNANSGFAFFLSSQKNRIISNTATGNTEGFRIQDSDRNLVRTNTASGNSPGDGFAFQTAKLSVIRGNIATSNGHDGFSLSGSSSNILGGNSANSNSHSGFSVYELFPASVKSNSNSLSRNIATSNGHEGFSVSQSDRNVLSFDIARSNGNGFLFYMCNLTTLSSSSAIGNGNGVMLNHSNLTLVNRNTAGFSSEAGFSFSASISNSVVTNLAVGNIGDGFLLASDAYGNFMSQNLANSNGAYGYRDLTIGFGTMGTANTHTGEVCAANAGGPSNPSGLC